MNYPARLAGFVLPTLVLALGVGFVSQSADATSVVAFSSFGPGNSYNTTVAWGVTGAATPGGYRGQAEWFIPSISGNLVSLDIAMFRQSGSGRVIFFVAEDVTASGTPGTVLESFPNMLSTGLLSLNSIASPLLQAGTKYWLCAEPADSTTVNGWFQNNQGRALGFAFERSPGTWEAFTDPTHSPPSGVFRVNVTPIPEPSLLTLGIRMLALGFIPPARARRK